MKSGHGEKLYVDTQNKNMLIHITNFVNIFNTFCWVNRITNFYLLLEHFEYFETEGIRFLSEKEASATCNFQGQQNGFVEIALYLDNYVY